MMDKNELEQRVCQYINENNIPAAVKWLFDLILVYANEKQFEKAKELRQKLIQIDSMALHEIIKSGEIIEQVQADSVDKDHLETWRQLYRILNTEEKNNLFFATHELCLKPGQILLEQGRRNPFLYLIDQGDLQISCRLKNKDFMIKKLGAGNFAGDDTFLSIQAFSSVKLMAVSEVKIRELPKEYFDRWSKELPGLYNKLMDYLYKAGTTHDQINTMNLKRRNQYRVSLTGIGRFQFLDQKGKEVGHPIKGSLLDFSVGGMSFAIRITKKETARGILGRRLNVHFEVQNGEHLVSIQRNGIIVSLGEYNLDDYAVHMKFDLMLDEALVKVVAEQKTLTEKKGFAR
jgi:CRP-like cAMP-binding protein